MLELYHNDMSTCAQKVRVTLEEKALAWHSHHLDLRAGDQQQPEYLALNPRGVVPTLVDRGRAVRESNVIMEYLEDEYPDRPLRPRDSYRRAQMRLWTKRLDEGHHDIATATLSMGIAFRHQYLARGPEACAALIERIPDPLRRERRRDVIANGVEAKEFRSAVVMWMRLLDDMEDALAPGAWLADAGYSLADAAYTPYLTRLDHLNLLGWLDRRPRLARWYERVRERPSYAAAFTKWENAEYIALMRDKGAEAWPRLRALAAQLA
ncbi:MAG: glutathione S-transferase family protein [Burkholderiales bacterium]|nr:glutathione S-transferase family protein [Burkholderiales bacterium]